MLKTINEDIHFINIDEWSFERSLHPTQSWIPKGMNAPILFNWSIDKATLILATIQTGHWFAFIKHGTVDSRIFGVFLSFITKISDWLELETCKKAVLLLDNAPTHKSSLTTEIIGKQGLQVTFLPAYSPEFAPVELIFGSIKSKMRSQDKSSPHNFGKESGIIEIVKSLMSLDEEVWCKTWIKVIIVCKSKIIAWAETIWKLKSLEQAWKENIE